MSRIKLAKGNQKDFLEAVRAKTGLSWDEIANLCGICPRSLRDWRREKYQMSLEAAKRLAELACISLPSITKVLLEHWSAKKASRIGALKRYVIYGNPGTPDERRKGGLRSQALRKIYPDRYPNAIYRKKIIKPPHSNPLAEFVGIMLGDGHVSDHQVLVYVNNETDVGYEKFVAEIMNSLFGIKPIISRCKDCKVNIVCASSVNLVEYLSSIGLWGGNKVKKQVEVPYWVSQKPKWKQSCLRGPWDTDGSIYLDTHIINGKKYINPGMTFTNRSLPLLNFVQKAMMELGYSPQRSSRFGVYLRREKEIHRYFQEVGTNNPKHRRRFRDYFES
jgi:DNA-binding XRE family transcriptional regulator